MKRGILCLFLSFFVLCNVVKAQNEGIFLHVGTENKLYYFSGKAAADGKMAWKYIEGRAKDIAINADGQMLVVGTNDVLYYSSGLDAKDNPNWKPQAGTWALRVTCAGDKFLHIGNDEKKDPIFHQRLPAIYYFSGKAAADGTMNWKRITGRAKDVAINSDGQMLVVGTDDALYYSSGLDAKDNPNWKKQAGTWASRVTCAGDKFLHIGTDNKLYYFSGKAAADGKMAWKYIEGRAKDIAINADGQMLVVGTDDVLYYSSGLDDKGNPNWKPQGGTWASSVASTLSATKIIKEDGGKEAEIGNIKIGDIVKIESAEKPGYFLADSGSEKSTLSQTGNIEWIVDRQGETGKALTSGTFPKLKNYITGKYLGGTAAGTPLPMGTNEYKSGEFWTPVDLSSNTATDINTLIATFHATKYPEKYTYVLYRGLSGKGDGKVFTTTGGYATVGIVPKINSAVNYDKEIVFVSNGGYILTNVPGYTKTVDNIAKWYIRGAKTSSDFPDEYACITPKANLDEITMGSKDGKLEIWGIDAGGKTYRFNEFAGAPYTMPSATVDPWEAKDLKDQAGKDLQGLSGICATCDGNLFGIRNDDKTAVKYDWAKKHWVKMDIKNAAQIKLEEITAAKGTDIYASSEDDKIYQLKNKTWVQISSGSSVAAGIGTDGKTIVIGLSTTGAPYEFKAGKWIAMSKDTKLNKIAIGNQDYILGINAGGQLVKWEGKNKTWNLIPGKTGKSIDSVDDIAAIASGTMIALDKFGNTWHKGDDAVTITAAGKVEMKKAAGTTVTKAVATKKVSTAPKKKTVKKVSKKKAAKKTKKAAKKTKKVAPKKRAKVKKVVTK